MHITYTQIKAAQVHAHRSAQGYNKKLLAQQEIS